MLHAGKLDRQILLRYNTTVKDSWNHDVKTAKTHDTVWAQRIDKRPSEEVENMGLTAITRTEWTIRYVAAVERTWWVEHNSQRFDIVGIRELGRKEYMVLVTEFREED